MAFEMSRGTNLSHWLSQSDRRGEERRAYLGRSDVELLARLGFDHLRIPVDEEQVWDASGAADEEAFGLLESALDWCAEAGLRAVVDLHILRSHHFNSPERPLWTDAAAQERFVECWRELSRRLGARPTDLVAYELLNEPVAEDPEDWNRAASRVFAALRELEPERTVVLGSNRWNSPDTFDRLAVPGDAHLVLTFHLYAPFLLTHHRAGWTGIGFYDGPVHYPGLLIEDKGLEPLSTEQRKEIEAGNGVFDRDALARCIAKPLAVAERTGLPLYCGEFGCIVKAPRPDRLRWYSDALSVFAEHRISWATWDYKGGFGLADPSGTVDEELARILTGK